MYDLFNDPRGNATQFIADALSEWDGDVGRSEAFYAGFFAAMKIYGLPCPIDPNYDVVEANAWAVRQILAAEAKHQGNELSKARKIIAALKLDKPTAKDFLLRPDFQGGTGECKSGIVYSDGMGTNISYESYHDNSTGLDSDFLHMLRPVRFLTALLGDASVVIRSDDYFMMSGLIEALLKTDGPDFRMQLLKRVGSEPEPGCLDLRPYAKVIQDATTPLEHNSAPTAPSMATSAGVTTAP